MYGCVERPDPWVGKDMLFLRVCEVLDGGDSVVTLSGDALRRVREVSGMLYSALVWERFIRDPDSWGAAKIPEFSMEALRLVQEVAESIGAPRAALLGRVCCCVNTLNALTVTQRPELWALKDAEKLCHEFALYLLALRQHRMSCTDDDDD